ncbi:helix-turn-helix domain-containing protein [Catenulispora rubra]|uniref:helix-turn-helix domain-containing protein n=1 Tax=Catenulispora rubra TaxID=280293 RepID=UPI00189259A0|nr:helix-turn-helix transcriptional regulator [Catenulispora rubra]
MAGGEVRRCTGCRALLSQYNRGTRCGACSRDARLAAAPELWATAQIAEALAKWDVGTVLRLYRTHTGARQMTLAAAFKVDQSVISRLENGRRGVADRRQILEITQKLGVPDSLLPALPAQEDVVVQHGALWLPSVDEVLSRLGLLTGVDVNVRVADIAADEGPESVLDVLLAWADSSQGDEVARVDRTGQRVASADVQTLSIMSEAFADADHRLGGGHARSTVAHYLSHVALPLASAGRYTDHVGRLLFTEVARLADVAGFMAFDAGQQNLARRYFACGLRLAKAAENYVLAAHILTDLSMQAVHLDHPGSAVATAQAAIEAAVMGSSPTTLARCHAVAARAAASANDPMASDRHLVQAERFLDRRCGSDEPRWISFFSVRQLTVEAMYASRALGRTSYVQRHADAAHLDEAAVDAMPRRDVLANTTLAMSYLQPDHTDVEHACAVMTGCLPLIGQLTSARAQAAIEQTRRRLADFSANAAVKELDAAFALAGGIDG